MVAQLTASTDHAAQTTFPSGETPNRLNVPEHGNGRRRERVAGFQRARLLVAITEISAEQGISNVTVSGIVARASVSRRTFYDLFNDRDECFLAALDAAIDHASQRVLATYDPSASWRKRVRGGLVAFLSFLDDNLDMARLMLVESLGAGPRAHERRDGLLALIVPVIDEGRLGVKREPPSLTAEGVVGGVLSVLHGRLVNRDARPLVELVNQLTSMMVLPYHGAAAADAELSLDTPAPATRSKHSNGKNPLKELPMRLTYRTALVLTAIAGHPGSSNRHLADAAEIVDQGQMSKLLTRLERLGLVENVAAGSLRGEPNAWKLTRRGEEVQDVLTVRG